MICPDAGNRMASAGSGRRSTRRRKRNGKSGPSSLGAGKSANESENKRPSLNIEEGKNDALNDGHGITDEGIAAYAGFVICCFCGKPHDERDDVCPVCHRMRCGG